MDDIPRAVPFDQLFHSLPSDGWLHRDEAELLLKAASVSTGDILEVGSYCGRSTALLASLGRRIHSVDPFDGFHTERSGDEIAELFWANMAARGIRSIVQHRIHVERWPILACGFAFLDGDHTYEGTCRQIDVALRSLSMGGGRTFCVHDYAETGGGALVKKAVDERPELVVLEVASTLAVCHIVRNVP
jgi:hypothetical protein